MVTLRWSEMSTPCHINLPEIHLSRVVSFSVSIVSVCLQRAMVRTYIRKFLRPNRSEKGIAGRIGHHKARRDIHETSRHETASSDKRWPISCTSTQFQDMFYKSVHYSPWVLIMPLWGTHCAPHID